MNDEPYNQPITGEAWSTLLTVPQVAMRLGIGRTKVYELMDGGDLRSMRIGTARRVPLAAVADYVRNALDASSGSGGAGSESSAADTSLMSRRD